MSSRQKVWFITGASRGLGAAISAAALAGDNYVAASFRCPRQAREFSEKAPEALGLVMDVTDPASIDAAVTSALNAFGRIDVLVNNAGAGLFGAIEEVEDLEFRGLMEINVFGALAVTRAVLPQLRAQRSGLIFQMSSISGVRAMDGLGGYAASKFALEGASEALALEVAPLGIKVVIVEPGPFRTEWIAGAASVPRKQIDDYASTAHATIQRLSQLDGKQPGAPAKAAAVLLSIAQDPDSAPLRLTLGRIAQLRLAEKLLQMQGDLRLSEIMGAATDYN